MSVGGSGIPRLQELAYVETAAQAVAEGKTFEQIRVAVVDRAARHAWETDTVGAFNVVKWEKKRADGQEFVHSTVDVLKELMRLGWIDRRVLPSTRISASEHAHATFTMTAAGREWTELVAHRPAEGFNTLAGALMEAHPQFEGFLRLVGARPDSAANHLTIPLMRGDTGPGRDDEAYLTAFIANIVEAVRKGDLGWSAPPDAISQTLRDYVSRARRRTAERALLEEKREEKRAAKYGPRKEKVTKTVAGKPASSEGKRRQLAALCEEAAVRLAFGAAGCPVDYISHELLRRWTRFLGLANFSYYAPGPPALRLWATSMVTGTGTPAEFRRAVGPEVERAAMEAVPRVWNAERGSAAQEMYRPVWRIRAAVCWDRRINDGVFDAALTAAARGEMGDIGFRVHLDEASHGRIPSSARPLVMQTTPGHPRIYHVMRIDWADAREEVLVR
ncbi:hypothetical protein OG349_19190 [Streptomyces sp. NBC_01317]|uniref:hypothetical protein n=1 Tax=Streptomyces sp. NBC_01317 TaxID=2903822 RepID=UPI002E0E2961|nr:hypothetical protein OG349_19190 [Streptomyces sp. NBC_01317]